MQKMNRSVNTNRAIIAGAFFSCLLAAAAHAAWWQWDGGAGDGDWQKADNWDPNAANPNYNGTFPDRLNVNGAQELIYTAAEGTTRYGTSAPLRGLAVGITTSGTMTIAGGTFSSLNGTQADAIGAYDNSTGILNISGGTFIGSSSGTHLGWHAQGTNRVSTMNVNSGSATLTSLILKSVNATVSLNGGTLAVNSISRSGGSGTLNLNGGTLKARATSTTFVTGLTAVNVLSGGAVIDTDGKNVTIANALLDGGGGGGLTKLGSGTLTLSGNNTFTGDVFVQGPGQLALATGTASGAGVIRLQSTQSSTGVTLAIHGGITVENDIVMDSTTGRENIRFTGDGSGVMNGDMTITGNSNNALIIESTKTGGTATWNGDITGLTYRGSVSLRGSGGTFNGIVTLASNLDHNGGGNWVVNAAGSDYVATRIQNNGNIILGADNALDTSARVLWSDNTRNGDLDLNGFNASVAGLDRPDTTSDPLVTNNGASDSVLTLAALEADRSFAGRITDGASGKVALVMNSAGRTQTLSGTNNNSGATTVSNGTLRLTQEQCLSTNTAITITGGGVLNLDFTGTNTVRSLQVGTLLRSRGVYGASRVPGMITGTGFLRTLEPAERGTVIILY